jgi:hypothetical protein
MTAEQAIKKIQADYKPDEIICLSIWERSDIHYQAEEKGMEITDEQADGILERMEDKFDANLGISWGTIDVYLSWLKTGL